MTKKILITDDNAIIRQILRISLECDGFSVIEATNGQEAINQVKKHNPDLIILDVMMPLMDGLTACATIKQNSSTAHIPIIILSAKSSQQDRALGNKAGANFYMEKPVKPSELIMVMNKFLQPQPDNSPIPTLQPI